MRKTRILVIFALLAFSAVSFSQAVPSSEKLMTDAKAKALKEKKSVWVVFHASW